MGCGQEETRRSAQLGKVRLNYYEAGPGFAARSQSDARTSTDGGESDAAGSTDGGESDAGGSTDGGESDARTLTGGDEAGGGLPLVMLHGGGPGASSWSNFGPALPHFAEHFRTLMVDQPGFGQSDKPPVQGNYYRHAATHILALLDELEIDKVHLLGNSLGGGTAVRLALMAPDRVGRLVLMGPGGLSLNLFHADPTEGVQRLMDFNLEPSREELRAFISTMVVDQELVTDELVEARFADATAPGSREAMMSMGMSFFNPETAEDGMLWREAHALRQHTLLTWGREDRVNPLDGAMVALKTIPKAQLHVFPRCGHWAQIEAAEEFADVAITFLKRHKEYAK